MSKLKLIIALAAIILFCSTAFSASYLKGVSSSDLNQFFDYNGPVWLEPRNNSFWTPTGSLDWNSEKYDVVADCFDWDNISIHPICSCDDLNTMDFNSSTLGWTYQLQNNIDFADCASSYTTGEGWDPIGISGTAFLGDFLGNNNKIKSLYIYRPATSDVGLFGYTSGADINNVGIIDANVTGADNTGALLGNGVTINMNGSYATGYVSGLGTRTGGLVGYVTSSTSRVRNSYFSGDVNGGTHTGGVIGRSTSVKYFDYLHSTGTVTGFSVGGVIGYMYSSVLDHSYSTATVQGTGTSGGITSGGTNNSMQVRNSYFAGSVTTSGSAGGIAGYNYQGTIINCYSTGTVIGNSATGGVLGEQWDDAKVYNSYNTGTVIGAAGPVGGVVGRARGTVVNSFSTGTIIGSAQGSLSKYGSDTTGISTNLYWYDSNSSDDATTCAYGTSDANCTYLDDANYTLLYDSTTDVYDTTLPVWDANWVWSGSAYPILSWTPVNLGWDAQSAVTDLDANLVAYYKFDYKIGTNIYDSARGYTGTLTGGVDINTRGMWDSNAGNFDGIDDSVEAIPNNTMDGWNGLSICAWINAQATNEAFDGIAFWRGATYLGGLHYAAAGTHDIRMNIITAAGQSYAQATTPSKVGDWYRSCGTWDGTTGVAKIYTNSVLDATGSADATGVLDQDDILKIALDDATTRFFNGFIDEVKIYDKALTAEEIIADYNSFLDSNFIASGNSVIDGSTIREWNYFKVNSDTYYDFGSQLDENGFALTSDHDLFDSNLVGLWHLNDDATDSSGQGNDLTWMGSEAYAGGLWGANAGTFDGSTDYLDTPDDTGASSKGLLSFADTDNFTLSFWYKGSDSQSSGFGAPIFGRNNGDIYATFSMDDGYVVYKHYDGGWVTLDSSSQINDNKWHHVVFVNHPNETGDLYVDGVKEADGESTSISNSSRYFTISSMMFGTINGADAHYTQGDIDEVAIWNKALTSAEVTDLYKSQAGYFHNNSNLEGLWHLNDDATDSSGKGFDGNWIDNEAYTTGLWNSNAGDFNGSSYIDLSGLDILGSQDTTGMTFSSWVYSEAASISHLAIVGGGGGVSCSEYCGGGIRLTSGKPRMILYDNSAYKYAEAPSVLSTDTWHHIVGTFNADNDTLYIYVDGILQGSTSGIEPLVGYEDMSIIHIGRNIRDNSPHYFDGQIEDVAIWDRTLTEQEVTDLYRKGISKLDLNVYSCSDENCAVRTSSQYMTDMNNNTDVALSLSLSTYLGYDVMFKQVTEFADYGANKFFVNSFLSDVDVDAFSGNNAPTLTINTLEGNSLSGLLPFFSDIVDANLVLDVNVLDIDDNNLSLTVRYSTSTVQGSGTIILDSIDLKTRANCDNTDFNGSTRCDVNFSTVGITDNNYYLLVELDDGIASTVVSNSTNKFGVDNTAPSITPSGIPSTWQRSGTSVTLACDDGVGSGCATTYYRIDSGAWQSYASAISIANDGNHQFDVNVVDAKSNWSDVNTYFVPIGFNGELTTYNDLNKPRHSFGVSEGVQLVFDVNNIVVPTITIVDVDGNVLVNGATMFNYSNDSNFGVSDLNTYYFSFDVNGSYGWYDVTVGNQLFENAFFLSRAWTDKYNSWDGNLFPFSFDLNIQEPNLLARWFYPV
ncbi:MAG: LamG domain-containing protein, partial [Candidatus Diapherotrites archaeon]|nr:LamG domain-containing protein [Candidatus Diapherotrites archaeon]